MSSSSPSKTSVRKRSKRGHVASASRTTSVWSVTRSVGLPGRSGLTLDGEARFLCLLAEVLDALCLSVPQPCGLLGEDADLADLVGPPLEAIEGSSSPAARPPAPGADDQSYSPTSRATDAGSSSRRTRRTSRPRMVTCAKRSHPGLVRADHAPRRQSGCVLRRSRRFVARLDWLWQRLQRFARALGLGDRTKIEDQPLVGRYEHQLYVVCQPLDVGPLQ